MTDSTIERWVVNVPTALSRETALLRFEGRDNASGIVLELTHDEGFWAWRLARRDEPPLCRPLPLEIGTFLDLFLMELQEQSND